jgi:hypothetical protein
MAKRKPFLPESLPSIYTDFIQDLVDCAAQSKNVFRPAFLVNLVFAILLLGIYLISIQAVFYFAYEREVQNIILNLLTMPVVAYLLNAVFRFYVPLVRTGKHDFKKLLEGHIHYFPFLLWVFLYYLLYLVLFKIFLNFWDNFGIHEELIRIRILLGVGFFLYLVARFLFSPLYIVEQGLWPRGALKSSFLVTSTRTMRCLLYALISFGILFAGWLPVIAVVALPESAPGLVPFVLVIAGLWSAMQSILVMHMFVRMFDQYRKNHPLTITDEGTAKKKKS